MSKKSKPEPVASIDVGSNFLRMMIAEITDEGHILPLEDLWKPTNIGRDAFTRKRIELESIRETCHTLQGFKQLMDDYRVKHYRAVATSGLREAENKEYVLEQIRLQSGLTVEVINTSQERFIIYKALRDSVPEIKSFRSSGFMVVNIGMGGLEASVYSEGHLRFTEYMKAGSLRLRQVLSDLENSTLDFPNIIEEFLESKIYTLKPQITRLNIKHVIGLGGELSAISSLCLEKGLSEREDFISKKALRRLFSAIRNLTIEQIMEKYELHHNEADILLPSVIIFNKFLDMTVSDGLHVPNASLRHGLLADMVDERFETSRKQDFQNDILSSVWYLASRFGTDQAHARHISELASSIFDQTKSLHRLQPRDRFLLEVAAILHDVGHYLNPSEHQVYSYQIICSSDIMGLSSQELEVIANIARYHSEEIPLPAHRNYMTLDYDDKIRVAKLAVILKLAEALDMSHQQKVKRIDISRHKGELVLAITSSDDTLLEEWSFAAHLNFFEEVMGLPTGNSLSEIMLFFRAAEPSPWEVDSWYWGVVYSEKTR